MKSAAVPVEGRNAVPEHEPAWQRLGRHGGANLAVACAQLAGWAALLTVLDTRSLPWAARAAALAGFCLMMQGVFTMLHEYAHRNAHARPALNYLIGWITGTIFGTAPTLMQVQHWGHHRRNRTESERGEFIHEDEDAWSKRVRYYAAILGGLWLGSFIFPILAPLLPYRALAWLGRDERFNTYAAGCKDITPREWRRLRIEGLAFLAAWVSLLRFGPWHWQTLAIAYASFAFTWSSLQWVYHLNTPIHVVEGAYNLRLPGPLRLLFLNFNYNLTHHRQPSLPWQELRARSDQRETQPMWYRYALVFLPPRPFPQDHSSLAKRHF